MGFVTSVLQGESEYYPSCFLDESNNHDEQPLERID